jgi:hypothetical protein
MRDEESSSKQRTLIHVIMQFLGGIALGLLFMLIPLSYISVSAIEFKLLHISALILLLLSFGILAASFGKKFLDPLMNFLESLPPIG